MAESVLGRYLKDASTRTGQSELGVTDAAMVMRKFKIRSLGASSEKGFKASLGMTLEWFGFTSSAKPELKFDEPTLAMHVWHHSAIEYLHRLQENQSRVQTLSSNSRRQTAKSKARLDRSLPLVDQNTLARHNQCVASSIEKYDRMDGALDPCEISFVSEFIADTCLDLLRVRVPSDKLDIAIGRVCSPHLEPSMFSAYTFMLSKHMIDVLGETLAVELRRTLCAKMFNISTERDVEDPNAKADALAQEIVNVLSVAIKTEPVVEDAHRNN